MDGCVSAELSTTGSKDSILVDHASLKDSSVGFDLLTFGHKLSNNGGKLAHQLLEGLNSPGFLLSDGLELLFGLDLELIEEVDELSDGVLLGTNDTIVWS